MAQKAESEEELLGTWNGHTEYIYVTKKPLVTSYVSVWSSRFSTRTSWSWGVRYRNLFPVFGKVNIRQLSVLAASPIVYQCLVSGFDRSNETYSVGLRVFCVGNSCFLRRWLVLVFFATVPVGGVFCNGGGCFLRRSWWEGMFFATAGHVFCIGRVCFLRWWCFLRR